MTNQDPEQNSSFQIPLDNSRKIAERFGYELNPDQSQLNQLIQHLTDNKANYGKYYCPCKQSYPVNPEKDPVCPCPDFREEIEKQGHCECHLFYSPEAAALKWKDPACSRA